MLKFVPSILLPALCVSVALNVALGWFVFHPAAPAVVVEVRKPAKTVVSAPVATAPSAVLDWKQIDAPDFATFISNLRRAGCPEHTIHRIVEGELHEVYAQKRVELEKQPAARSTRQQQLQRLVEEEAEVLASLLTPATTAASNAVAAATPSPEPPPRDLTLSMMPAAFMVGNAPGRTAVEDGALVVTPTDTQLDPAALQTLQDMRQAFGDRVQSAGAATNSREYQRQWLKARRDSDEAFSSMYGGDALIRAEQQALAQGLK